MIADLLTGAAALLNAAPYKAQLRNFSGNNPNDAILVSGINGIFTEQASASSRWMFAEVEAEYQPLNQAGQASAALDWAWMRLADVGEWQLMPFSITAAWQDSGWVLSAQWRREY